MEFIYAYLAVGGNTTWPLGQSTNFSLSLTLESLEILYSTKHWITNSFRSLNFTLYPFKVSTQRQSYPRPGKRELFFYYVISINCLPHRYQLQSQNLDMVLPLLANVRWLFQGSTTKDQRIGPDSKKETSFGGSTDRTFGISQQIPLHVSSGGIQLCVFWSLPGFKIVQV